MRNFFKITFVIAAVIIAAGYLIPERKAMPCCTPSDYNHQSFWHWPWTRGTNGHPHTGVDIFGKVGTPVVSQTGGIVIYADEMPGKAGEKIATLGKTGNAAATPAHVHYGIITPIPYVWKAFGSAGTCNPPSRFNWRLMFWLDPADHLPIE